MELNKALKLMLVPAGDGVFTVNTAKEKKAPLQESLYGQNIEANWSSSLSYLSHKLILGVPSDAGAGIIRGSNWGPLFIRNEIKDYELYKSFQDLGDVRVIPHFHHDKYLNETTIRSCQHALYHGEDLPVSSLSICEKALNMIYQKSPDTKVFGMGGDHSVSYPLVKSFLEKNKARGKTSGLIHFDAHTDLLEKRLGVDICFGSWTYHVLDFMNPSDVHQIGIRSSGKPKDYWQERFGLRQYWPDDLEKKGHDQVAKEICAKLSHLDEIYISFDIDALDASEASATGTPEENGLSVDQAISMIEIFGERLNIRGADLVEVAPFLQTRPETKEPETTLNSAKQIALALLKALD